jgi:hypothetical protein
MVRDLGAADAGSYQVAALHDLSGEVTAARSVIRGRIETAR